MENQIKKKEKNVLNYINFLKGIGAISVIVGHMGINRYLTLWLYLFHMPLFFFISGFLEKEYSDLKSAIFHKAKKLLYPYFSLGVLLSLFYSTIFDYVVGKYQKYDWVKRIICLLYGNYIDENNYNNTLWFLAALFTTSVIFFIIITVSKKNDLCKIVLVGLTISCGCLYEKLYNNGICTLRLPYYVDIASLAIGFYMGGYLYKKIEKVIYRNKIIIISLGLIVGSCMGIANYAYMDNKGYKLLRVDMLHLNFGFIPFFYGAAFCLIVTLFVTCKAVYEKVNIRIIENVGKYSLLFMAIHTYIIKVLKLYDYSRGIKFVMVLMTTYMLSYCIDKYFPFLYRRNEKVSGLK